MSEQHHDKHGRTFDNPGQIAAGYHLQEWGPIPSPRDEIIGTYDTPLDGTIAVRHIEKGPSGNPELELEWADGMRCTVLDAATAWLYLNRDMAQKRGRAS